MIVYVDEPRFKPYCMINNFPIYKVACALYFKKNNRLFLFRPVYHPCLPKNIANELNIIPSITNTNILTFVHLKTYTSTNCQTSHINEYNIIGDCPNTILITIDNIEYKINAIDALFSNTVDIFQCTTFKDDYKNVKNHVDYYYNYHGIKNYLLYYNHEITDDLKDVLKNIPSNCNIYVFSLVFPWRQTFCGLDDFNKPYWSHNTQNLQLAHSAIIANFCSTWLMNVDLDEYVDNDIRIDSIVLQDLDIDIININFFEKSCSGQLCHLDYTYNYTEIINKLKNIGKSTPKFIQKTLGKCKYQRQIHSSLYFEKNIKNLSGSHVKCLSWSKGEKRICTPL
jgi:hypothetical protein